MINNFFKLIAYNTALRTDVINVQIKIKKKTLKT